MKFQPTLWKTIISVILGIIGAWCYWYLNARSFVTGAPTPSPYPLLIIGLVLSFLIVYIIWSLFQNKK